MVASASHGCDDDRLRRLLNDALEESEEGLVVAHLSECAACQNRLDALTHQDRWWGTFDDFLGQELDGDELASSCRKPGASRRAAGDPGDDDDETRRAVLTLLDRPERDGSLGRLAAYDVTSVVGQGGMGIVLRAFDQGLGRTVAIKLLAPEMAFLSSARKRFAREARAAASVVHENVVAIHAVDMWKGLPYLVMQDITGISLQERINGNAPLGVLEILRISKQIAAGLAAAHAQGLVHRDIKPSNILLENGVARVKITDFGLARTVADASLSQSGVISGTPQYMAPEQTRCERVDPRADLFSLGSVMYAMCTGHSPFRAETTMAVLRRVCDDEPRSIRQQNPEIPAWLADIIATLLAKKPEQRFESARDVEELLGRCLVYVELPHDGPPPYRDPRRLAKGRPIVGTRVAIVAVVAIVVLFAMALVLLWNARENARRRAAIETALRQSLARGMTGSGLDHIDRGRQASENTPRSHVEPAGKGVDGGDRLDFASGTHESSIARAAELLRPVPISWRHAVEPWPFGIVSAAGYSVDGARLALACGDGSVVIVETATGRVKSILSHHAGRVWSVAFSPDGRFLICAAGVWANKGRGGEVTLWDLTSETIRARLTDDAPMPFAVAYSRDGKTLAWAGRDREVTVWDTETSRARAVCQGHEWTVRSIAFHPVFPTIVSTGFDGTIRFWDARTGEPQGSPIRQNGRSSNCVAISPDGEWFASNSGPRADEPGADGPVPGWISIWNWRTRQPVRRLEGFQFDVLGMAFAPDGKTLASAGGYYDHGSEVKLWDVDTGRCRAELKGHQFWVEAVAFSPDGKRLVTTGGAEPAHGEVRLWDLMSPVNPSR